MFATFRTVGGISFLICSFSFFNELCILFRKSDRKSLSSTISRPEMKAFEMCSIAASEPVEREGSAVRTGLTSCLWHLKKSSQLFSFATMWIDFNPGIAPHCSCRASCSLVGRQNWPRIACSFTCCTQRCTFGEERMRVTSAHIRLCDSGGMWLNT